MAEKKTATSQATAGGSFWQKVREPVISLFLIYTIAGVGIELCAKSPFRDALKAPFNSYLWYTGLWQNFSVFAPNPKNYNIYLTAVVKFDDGSRAVWQFPRTDTMDVWTRMHRERYRKWAHDNVNSGTKRVWWPDTVRYIARQFKDDRRRPVQVTLVRHWTEIPPPQNPGKEVKEKVIPFYTQAVSPEDLE